MSECRICYGAHSYKLVSPCKCKGSINYVHEDCLIRWLRKKYPTAYHSLIHRPKPGPTGLFCELCKYEYKGRIIYLKNREILKQIQKSNTTYSIMINIPIMIYLSYKWNFFFKRIFQYSIVKILEIQKKSHVFTRLGLTFKLFLNLFLHSLPLAFYSAALSLIVFNTIKLSFKLLMEFKIIQFENFVSINSTP